MSQTFPPSKLLFPWYKYITSGQGYSFTPPVYGFVFLNNPRRSLDSTLIGSGFGAP